MQAIMRMGSGGLARHFVALTAPAILAAIIACAWHALPKTASMSALRSPAA
jgi:hypothetical protein